MQNLAYIKYKMKYWLIYPKGKPLVGGGEALNKKGYNFRDGYLGNFLHYVLDGSHEVFIFFPFISDQFQGIL